MMSGQPPVVIVDFETRSYLNVKDTGAWRYAEDPTTEILCLGYKIGDAPAELWVPDITDFPQELLALIEAGAKFEAHNVQFERAIWHFILNKKMGIPMPRRWKDTLAVCAYRGIPLSLDKAGDALRLPIKKDKRGKYLLQQLCTPKWGTKKNPDRVYREDFDLMQDLYDYCLQDCEAEYVLSKTLGDLPPNEYGVWVIDQRINQRGVLIDLEAVNTAVDLITDIEKHLHGELKKITKDAVEKPTQGARMLKWFHEHGLMIDNLQKETIADLMQQAERGELDEYDPEVIRAIEIRSKLAKSSTSKLTKMQQTVSMDGRIRGLLQYHGAGTGRWAGRLVQPQNFPRAIFKENMDALVEAIKLKDYEYLDFMYGNAMDAIATSLRGMFIAEPGHELHICDFSAIEARVTFWVAGCEIGLDVFHKSDRKESEDIYCVTASDLVGFEVKKALHELERQLGKITVLGCFGENTLVLTNNGFKKIKEVKLEDNLWDGSNWVSHQGVIYQGLKDTIQMSGVTVTPDHKVWSGKEWVSAEVVEQEDHVKSLALVQGLKNLPLLEQTFLKQGGLKILWSNAFAELSPIPCCSTILLEGRANDVINVLKSNLDTIENTTLAMLTLFQMKNIESDYLIESLLVFKDAITLQIDTISTMESEAYTFLKSGKKIEENFLGILSLWKDGMYQSLNLIELMLMPDTSQETLDSYLNLLTYQIKERFKKCNEGLTSWRNVYDIADAGPLNRFMIWTDDGPMIVHNCGYQMGWSKLQFQAAKDYNVVVSDEEAQNMVNVYREKYSEVKYLWYGLEEAAIATVRTGYSHSYGKIVYELIDDAAGRWLACLLPNGRRIWYYNPAVVKSVTSWGAVKDSLEYEGRDNKKGGAWGRIRTYGGMLCENVVQAIARDLMVEAIIRVTKNGFPVILTVHDEIIAEVEKGTKDFNDFLRLMAENPVWAPDCPIAVEGGVVERYQKV